MDNAITWGVVLYLSVRVALFAALGFWLYRVLRPQPEQQPARSNEQSRYALERRHDADRQR